MKKRLLPACLLIAYSALLVKLMVLKDLPAIRIGAMIFKFGGTHDGPPNLVPFRTILPYLLGEKGLLIAAINIGGNILLLVPIGFMLPFVFQNITWKKSIAIAVAAGSALEGMQALLQVGIFDIDDILLNALGVMIGYWLYIFFTKRLRLMRPRYILVIAGVVIVIAIMATLYVMHVYQQRPLPALTGRSAEGSRPDSIDNKEDSIQQAGDPCKGTGGTGQVLSVVSNSITIRLHNGRSVVINFTDQTIIRNAAGAALSSSLKVGDRVTVVAGGAQGSGKVAEMVLVCN